MFIWQYAFCQYAVNKPSGIDERTASSGNNRVLAGVANANPRGKRRIPISELDHALAAIFTGEKADQRSWRVLQPLDDVFLDLQLAGSDP